MGDFLAMARGDGYAMKHLTLRAADGATPRGDRRGENSELRAPTVVLEVTPRR